MRTIGVLGGMSWESTAVYYRLLNHGARARLGGLHSAKLLVWSADFAEIAAYQTAEDWQAATATLIDAARAVERGGAACLLLATNTMHRCAEAVQAAIDIPLLHIADATAAAIHAQGARSPLLLATRYTMEQDFYTGYLATRHGVRARTPEAAARAELHRIIFDELCQGAIVTGSKRWLQTLIERAQGAGADGVIFGCTEIGLLLGADDVELPVFDSTALHVAAALDFALGE